MKSMLLVDILARELKVWPEGLECLSQIKGAGYIINGKGFDGRAFDAFQIADETLVAGAIVTRAEWQAAVEALKAEEAAELKWPDGAEFMGTTKEGDPKVFYKNVGDGTYEYRDERGAFWWKNKGTPIHTPLIPRPTERAVEWDGVGLPPAGTVCAVLNSALRDPAWERCAILYSGKHRVMYDSESCEERVAFIQDLKFRTQEQVAAEEREKVIREMRDIGIRAQGRWAEAIYDAGYRKQVAK